MFLSTEYIQSLTLSSQPGLIKEGTENFTLQHSMLQGVFEQQMWFFNGIGIKNSSHYLVKTQANSLVILRPNRNDTGEYAVLLTNPFRNATASQNVSVWCKFISLKVLQLKVFFIYILISFFIYIPVFL